MSLDTSKKSQYHSALAMNSPITVKVVAGPRESQYKKKGEPGHLYAKLDFNGYVFSYGAENEGCAKPFEGKEGDVITIQASGRGEDARIEIVDGPQKAVSSTVEAPSARPDAPRVSTQQVEAAATPIVKTIKQRLGQLSDGYKLVLAEMHALKFAHDMEFNDSKMSDDQFTKVCNMLFMDLVKTGMIEKLPLHPIDPPKKDITREEVEEIF